MSYQGQSKYRDPVTGGTVTEPAVWYVADGSDIRELDLSLEASDTLRDQFVYFTTSDGGKLRMEDKDGSPPRLILCAFYDRVV